MSAIRIDRCALGGAAGHLTAGDPDGATWRHLIHRVIDGRPIDLLHAHATGTIVNDPIELAAMESVIAAIPAAGRPSLYSHKGAMGHSLGAAGMVSIVMNCLMHEAGVVLPNVRTTHALPMERVTLSREEVRKPIQRSLASSSGFGGPTAVVGLEMFCDF